MQLPDNLVPTADRAPDKGLTPASGSSCISSPLCLCCPRVGLGLRGTSRKGGGQESSSAQREKRRPQGSLCALRTQLRLARSVSMPAKLPSYYLICFISPKKFTGRSEKISKGLFTCSAPELDRKLKTFCKFKRKILPLKF